MKKCILIAVVLIMSSCATLYGPSGYKGGYSEIKLSEDVYEVSFNGNGYTSGGVIKNYFLYRCAEITLEKGGNFFIMYDKKIGSITTSTETRGTINSNGSFSSSTSPDVKSYGVGTIKILKEKPIDYEGIIYDAVELKTSLEPRIRRGHNNLF